MRRQLMLTAAAVSTMIVLAFVVPLGVLVKQIANDRALRGAEQRAAALVPVLATVTDAGDLSGVVDGLNTGDPAFVSVARADGSVLGEPLPTGGEAADLELARTQRTSFSIAEPGGMALYMPVVKAGGEVDVVRAFVPDAVLTRGVVSAWLLLGALGGVLILGATFFADRLGRSVVEPVGALARTAERLGRGDLAARVEPDGPPEIAEVGDTLNQLADRMQELLIAERESVADLSHRLRTPVTALKLDVEAVGDPLDRQRLMDDVEALQRAVTTLINEARRVGDPGSELSDLVGVTRERVAFWSALAEDQERAFDLRLPPNPLVVPVAGAELAAALDALLGNVLAHTPDRVAFRVLVRPLPTGSAELIVEDDGPGFPTNGDPVARGSSGGGSTGLGLDIVRRTAADAGGTMTITRSRNGGGRVSLAVPLADVRSG